MNAGAGESGLRFGLFIPTEMPELPFENPFADAERFAASPVSQWVSMVAEQKALPDQSPSRETNQPQLDLAKLFPYTEEDIKALYDDFAQIIEDNKTLTYKNKWGVTQTLDEGSFEVANDMELEQMPHPELWGEFLERHDITDEKALGLDLMMRYLMLYDRTDVLPLPLEGYPLTNKGDRVQWPHAWKFESLTMALQRTVKKRRPDLVFSYAYTICQLCYWYGTQETYVETYIYRKDETHPISSGFPLRHTLHVCESNMQGEFEHVAPMVLAFYRRWGEPARQADWEEVYKLSTAVLLHLLAHGVISEDQLFTQME